MGLTLLPGTKEGEVLDHNNFIQTDAKILFVLSPTVVIDVRQGVTVRGVAFS